MYAITFDLDTICLKEHYHTESSNNAYLNVKTFLIEKGFTWTQGSVYFGSESTTVIDCVLAVQELSRTYDWVKTCVKDLRMLKIEENNDLIPLL
tara:strand:+ start:514 stop:795 length:282 start_codon:yes stop_codon:yes gene_type:complete